MMKTIKWMALLLFALSLTGCSDDEQPKHDSEKNIEMSRAESEAMDNIANFSFKIFKTAYQENKNNGNGNFVIAPFNLATSLAMIGNAADTRTKGEILRLFDMEDEGIESLNKMFEKILTEMPKLDSRSNILLANSIWTDIDTTVPDWYVERMATHFKAPVNVLEDMRTKESAARIDQWIKSATNGMIDLHVDYTSVLDDEVFIKHFVALNAMYFKGQWREKFDKAKTEEKIFYNADGTTSMPMTMTGRKTAWFEGHRTFVERYLYNAARLPYGNNSYALTLFEPYQKDLVKVTMDELVEHLAEGGWNEYVNADHTETSKIVQMPRFEINNFVEFNDILLQNGVDLLHDSKSGLDGLTLLDTKYKFAVETSQQTIFKVDEEGSEAISVTHSNGHSKYPTSDLPTMHIFDRPFIFVLSERSTGAILVAGCVNKL